MTYLQYQTAAITRCRGTYLIICMFFENFKSPVREKVVQYFTISQTILKAKIKLVHGGIVLFLHLFYNLR